MYGYIYMTINIFNGKRYIGKKKSDKFLANYKGSGKIVIQAFNKYGFDNFAIELLDIAFNEDDLNRKERLWIDRYNAVNDKMFYNIHEGGNGGCTIAGYSIEEKESFKRRVSESLKGDPRLSANKGITMSLETKKKISESCKRTLSSPEVRAKISKAHKGRKRPEETGRKISEKLKGNTNSKGYKRTDDEKKCVSENQKGRICIYKEDIDKRVKPEELEYYLSIGFRRGLSEKRRKQISENQKGRPSPMKGRKLSDEHKRKMLESRQRNKNQSTIES